LQEYDACYKEKYFTHCPKCNADNPETAIFCADCGTKLLVHKDIALTKTIEAPKEELTTGAVFAGRYQIIEELGKGGMGRIYKVRGFCPSCHAKRRKEWGEWMREKLILDTPHRQVVFTIPKMLRIFFKYNRSLLSSLCRCGKEALEKYLRATTRRVISPGIIAVIQSFGSRINFHPHLHFLVTEGGIDKQDR